jgi:hypothetical protein
VATAAILNWRVEVGDDRRGGATWQVRVEREGERGGSRSTDRQRPTELGRGKGADRWATATVPGGGTG